MQKSEDQVPMNFKGKLSQQKNASNFLLPGFPCSLISNFIGKNCFIALDKNKPRYLVQWKSLKLENTRKCEK